jgi:cold shock protein
MQGTVKFFNTSKNFGFISGEDGNEYFVHISGMAEGTSLNEEDKVEFEVVEGERGPKADKVKKIE